MKPHLILLLILGACLSPVFAACPTNLLPTCLCEDQPLGFYVKCRNVDTNLTALVHSMGKLRVQRLTVINASWPVLERVPSVSVRSLHLIDCKFTRVEENAFAEVSEELEELVLSNNSLTTVPLLGSLPRLLSLNLNYNELIDISEGSLEGASNLRHLRVEGNKICALSRNALNESKGTLELLDMSGNCFKQMPAQNLRNCVRLMYLDMSENKIAEIANFELMNLPLLKELRISQNELSSVAPMAFMNVPQLQYLYMQRNSLASIDSSRLFQVFKHLEILDLSHNLLTKVPSFKELSNIRQVRLDYNRIDRVETLAFSSNPRLQLISLQNNKISSISRNSFDSLDQLVILLLSNNSIKSIERGMLDGMRNLQQLNLRNNSLSELGNTTFNSVPLLTTLDVSFNGLHRISKETFSPLKKLFWLDLSSNLLSTLEKGTFTSRVANILLHDNPLYCDDKMDWLVEYLVRNQVRTFLPYQPEVSCVGPEKFVGVRLKELLIKKANETLNAVSRTLGTSNGGKMTQNLLNSLLPAGIGNIFPGMQPQSPPNPFANVPVIGAITEAIPAMRNIPGLNFIPKAEGEKVEEVRTLNNAIEQFSAPLIRVATGGQPVPSDVEQMIHSIPNLVVSVPGFGNIDVSKLPPDVIAHVLRGGQIPGVPKEALDKVVADLMKRMHAAAEAANRGKPLADQSRYLPPLENLPPNMITEVVRGVNLPHLDEQQTNTIKEYYTAQLPTAIGNASAGVGMGSFNFPPELIEMMKLLPPGYDIGKIPKEVMQAVSRGEIPDFGLLPADLQQYLMANSQKLFSSFSNKPNISVDDILKNLPRFERPDMPTFSPYDINEVSSDLTHAEKEAEKLSRVQYYTAVGLGLVGAVSLAVMSLLCIHMRRKRLVADGPEVDEDSLVQNFHIPPPQATSSPKVDPTPSYLSAQTPSRRKISRVPPLI